MKNHLKVLAGIGLFLIPALAWSATHNVSVGDNFFSPNNLTIDVGDTVRWSYSGSRNHDVTADDFSWASVTSNSFTYERTFNSIEEVLYHCTVHSSPGGNNMNGRINVIEGTGNAEPNALFSSSCAGLNCDFTDLSTDSDGTIASRSWSFGDGGSSTATNPSHTYASGGTYSVMLTVTDNAGGSDTETDMVTVAGANEDPNASFSFSCNDLDCNFTDQSSDSDGTIASWAWSFGDSGTSTAQSPAHSYAAAGTYSVDLTVTDNDGAQDSSFRSVTVTDPQQNSFLINIGMTDAWFSPATDGQGFFIIVWGGIKFMFLSWFTFDTELPPAEVIALLGDPGQRWLTAQGPFDGDTATLDVFISSGGTFDSADPEVATVQDGTMTITWTSCNSGILTYNIPSLGLMGQVPIERIVLSNVPLCESGQSTP